MKTTLSAKALCLPKPSLPCLWSTIFLFGSAAGFCAGYSVTDLGPGVAYDINSAGKIAAYINGQPVVTDGASQQPISWFGPYPPLPDAINDASDVLVNGPDPMDCQIINGTNAIHVANNIYTRGLDLNNDRVVCGFRDIGGLATGGQEHAFKFDGQTGIFELFMDSFSHANAINNQGLMVGLATTNFFPGQPNPGGGTGWPTWQPAAACVFSNQIPVFIDSRQRPAVARDLGGASDLSEALGVNDNGQVAGWYRPNIPGPRKAFRYRGAGLEDLGTLGGTNSVATHINGSGVIIGWSETTNAGQHAFVYANDTMTDLNSLLPPGSSWVLQVANSINDAGQIVGYGLYQGVQHGFLVSPPGLGVAPVVVGQPLGGQAPQEGSYTFTVVVDGTEPFVYQWQKGGTNISGANGSSLTLTNLTAFDSGNYRVVITNAAGTAISQEATLTVLDPQLSIHAYAGLTVAGEIGGTYRIDYITNASSSAWIPLTSFQLTNQSQLFIDLETPVNPQRIYRAVRVQ